MPPCSTYYYEKATNTLKALARSSASLSDRVKSAAQAFALIPPGDFPEDTQELVDRVLRKLVFQEPENERLHGDDDGPMGKAIKTQGRIMNNVLEMSWQKKKALADDMFHACIGIICWAGKRFNTELDRGDPDDLSIALWLMSLPQDRHEALFPNLKFEPSPKAS